MDRFACRNEKKITTTNPSINMKIDSHHHFWKYDPITYSWMNDKMDILKVDYQPVDLKKEIAEVGIDGVVSVQADQSLRETDDLLEHAKVNDFILAVVGWLPLANDNVSDLMDKYADNSLLKGIRHVVQDEPDDEFLLREDFNRGISELRERDLVYDILIYGRQLPAAIQFADLHADQSMILDHIAKPTIRQDSFDEQWKRDFAKIAERENLTCKFSGVVTEIRDPSWDIHSVRPYWETALEAFTPKRLMFGSDWPVCLLKTEHRGWLQIVKELASELSDSEQEDFFFNNAIKAYQLDTAS